MSCLITIFTTSFSNGDEIDFISILKGSPEAAKAVGLGKLTLEEQQALNALLNRAYQLGAENKVKQKQSASQPKRPKPKNRTFASNSVYITKIDENNGDILKFDNGGIVEITLGFLGFVGFRKDAVLFKDGFGWKIWIEGKRAFKCDLLKAPETRSSGSGNEVYISEVKGDGKILIMADGSMYEVDDLYTIETSLWLGNSAALLIDGNRMLNLDEGGEIIDVTKLK